MAVNGDTVLRNTNMSNKKPSDKDLAAAEEYCDQPRCAQMTTDDKAWHRSHAALLAGLAHARLEAQGLVEALESFIRIGELAGTFGYKGEYFIDPSPSAHFGRAAINAKKILTEYRGGKK